MGCGRSAPKKEGLTSSGKNDKFMDTGQDPIPDSNFLSTASVSDQSWADCVSFQTFVLQSDSPQIFEYRFLRPIGRGAQAEVYLVENTETHEIQAAKVYDKTFLYRNHLGDNEQPIQKTVREIQIMSSLHHPNCMSLLEVLDDDYTNSIIIIQPYADGGSLLPQKAVTEPFPEDKARRVFFQIACGLGAIHALNICHRDLKPENILTYKDGRVVISDFSASVVLPESDAYLDDTDGTPAFYSPEQCTGQPYKGKPTDIWALGVSLYILLYGHLPFFDVNDEGFYLSQFFKIAKQIQTSPVEFNPEICVSDQARNLIKRCLDKNPDTRPNIEEVLKDEWLLPCYEDDDLMTYYKDSPSNFVIAD